MPEDELDEGVRLFVTEVTKGYAALSGTEPWSAPVARRLVETVRTPWRQGGPKMSETIERIAPTPHGGVRVRIYRPSPGASKPALVYMHGGGFTLFSIDTHDRLMREYAARADMVVVGVDYALSPEARFPVALEQVVAVVRWLAVEAASLGIDPDRLAAGGDSAGGNLATSAAIILRDAGEGQHLKALLLSYGGFGGDVSDATEDLYGGGRYMLNREESRFYWRNYLGDSDPENNPLARPIRARLEGLPPCFLVIAECDINVEQNTLMAERLEQAGVEVRANIYKGATHSFLEAMSVSAVANQAIDDSAAWLRKTLGV